MLLSPARWLAPMVLGLAALAQGLSFPKSTLYVEQGGRRHTLKVEVADTPERQAQGLMFRKSLGEDEGMVFLFPTPTAGGFWMKNTLIPLPYFFTLAAWQPFMAYLPFAPGAHLLKLGLTGGAFDPGVFLLALLQGVLLLSLGLLAMGRMYALVRHKGLLGRY